MNQSSTDSENDYFLSRNGKITAWIKGWVDKNRALMEWPYEDRDESRCSRALQQDQDRQAATDRWILNLILGGSSLDGATGPEGCGTDLRKPLQLTTLWLFVSFANRWGWMRSRAQFKPNTVKISLQLETSRVDKFTEWNIWLKLNNSKNKRVLHSLLIC